MNLHKWVRCHFFWCEGRGGRGEGGGIMYERTRMRPPVPFILIRYGMLSQVVTLCKVGIF